MYPHVIGHWSKMVLMELIEHLESHQSVWFAAHAEVARQVAEQAGLCWLPGRAGGVGAEPDGG
jgi:hypothetical protein